MPLVSVTPLLSLLPIFFIQALRSARQAARTEGNLAARILRNPRNTFWTATMSTDEALKQFMQTGVHGRIMRKLLDWWRLWSVGVRMARTCPHGRSCTCA
jgi:hypothetical protein